MKGSFPFHKNSVVKQMIQAEIKETVDFGKARRSPRLEENCILPYYQCPFLQNLGEYKAFYIVYQWQHQKKQELLPLIEGQFI